MAISLQKGGNVNLSKTDPNLKQVLLGLGWDARSSDGVDFDLDASIFMVTESGRVRADNDFIFYGQLRSPCGSIEHTGDNRTGAGADNVVTTYSIATAAAQALTAFAGKNTAGNWSLKVQDIAAQDVGTLNSWTITFNGEQSLSPGLAIPIKAFILAPS